MAVVGGVGRGMVDCIGSADIGVYMALLHMIEDGTAFTSYECFRMNTAKCFEK